MWPRKKFWWETGGTPPLQSPNPATTIPDDDPMFKWQAGMLFPTIPLETFDESKAAFSPIRERKILPMPYSYSHGSVDPGLNAANARVASGTTIPQTSTAKKKGLSLKNMINAMSKLKAPTGEDFSRVSGRAGGPRPTAPSPRALGVDALEMASADDPRKKWWKQWQGLMGA